MSPFHGELDFFRGHLIKYNKKEDSWFYIDTGKRTVDTWKERGCGYCGKSNTSEGHDGCLGTLENVHNACCGHGNSAEAYVQFDNGEELRGELAISYFQEKVKNGLSK